MGVNYVDALPLKAQNTTNVNDAMSNTAMGYDEILVEISSMEQIIHKKWTLHHADK